MKKIFLSLAVIGLFLAGNTRAAMSTYVVKNGDTLCGIGAKFGISCKSMVANFSGKNPNLIHPGDKFEFGRPDGLLGGLISKPYTFAPNTVIYSSQVNSDFDTIYTLVNGNLNNANIVAGAAISSTKINGTAIVSTGATYQAINGSTTIFGELIVSSTENYFRVPVMTTAQRDALTGVEAGAIIYSTDAGQFYVREGSSWAAISPAAETALANSSTKGIVQEATTSSIYTGAATGTTGARLYINPTIITTSSLGSIHAYYLPALSSSGTLSASFGGVSSSVATLDNNTLVVQNPANATSTPTANKIPISTISSTLSLDWLASIFGDGSDGDVTISANTTLVRDMYYNTLTINSGVIVTSSGWRIFVKGAFINNGTTTNSGFPGTAGGTAGEAGIRGSGGAGGSLPAGSFGTNGGVGGNSGDGASSLSSTSTLWAVSTSTRLVSGAKGGDGGLNSTGSVKPAGVAGTSTPETVAFGLRITTSSLLFNTENISDRFWTMYGQLSQSLSSYPGSTGGGGGSCGNCQAGGGGGGGGNGGAIYIAANSITNNGAIISVGGAGGAGGNGSGGVGGGAGGGGAGGVVGLTYKTFSGNNPIVTGGAKGNLQGGGSTPATEAATGTVGVYIKLKIN